MPDGENVVLSLAALDRVERIADELEIDWPEDRVFMGAVAALYDTPAAATAASSEEET